MSTTTQSRKRGGFTLIEVLAVMLVVGMGMFAVIGLLAYGIRLSAVAQSTGTGMATAVSVAYDNKPLLDDVVQSVWNDPAADCFTAPMPRVTTGFINGYYVVRTETRVAATDTISVGHVMTTRVDVDVYATQGSGEVLAAFTTRLVRQK